MEFLLEGTGDAARFYFLEMNTRLQVEHPVTEQVTGVDLVRAQIAVASGEPLPWRQETLGQRGHAIEARVYAEDPARNDLPQAGPLLLYREPSMPGIRVDAGVIEGSEVSVHYDPLLAKLIAWGETRDAARRRALAALRSYPVLGIRTNIALLIELLEHPRFVSGSIDTGFLDAEGDAIRARLSDDTPPVMEAVAAAARAARQPVLSDQPAIRSFRTGHHRPVDLAAWRACLSPWTRADRRRALGNGRYLVEEGVDDAARVRRRVRSRDVGVSRWPRVYRRIVGNRRVPAPRLQTTRTRWPHRCRQPSYESK